MIYFIHKPNEAAVKIGYSADPMVRLGTLQVASPSPLRMYGILSGAKDAERTIHSSFRSECIRGEWYKEGMAFRLYRNLSRFAVAWLRIYNADGFESWYYKPVAKLSGAEAEVFLSQRLDSLKTEAARIAELLSYFDGKFPSFIGNMRAVYPEVDQYLIDFMNGDKDNGESLN